MKNAENLKGSLLKNAENLKETNPVYAENLNTSNQIIIRQVHGIRFFSIKKNILRNVTYLLPTII